MAMNISGIYTPQDVGGFGRLAEITLKNRQLDQQDQQTQFNKDIALQQLDLQKQARGEEARKNQMTLAELNRQTNLQIGLESIISNLPETADRVDKENAAAKFFMEKGEVDRANAINKSQSESIKMLLDKNQYEAATALANRTLGAQAGLNLKFEKDKDKNDFMIDEISGKIFTIDPSAPDGIRELGIKAGVKPDKEPTINEYNIFYAARKKEGLSDAQIDEIWRKRRQDLVGNVPVVVQTAEGPQLINRKEGTASPIKSASDGSTVNAPPQQEVKTAYIALEDNINSVNSVRQIYTKGSTGPVAGRAKKFGTKFYNDAEFTALKNRVAQLRSVVYGLSGKAINETEQDWLDNDILPNITQPNENFEATLNEFENWVKYRKGRYETQYPGLIKKGSGTGKEGNTKQSTAGGRITVVSPDGRKGTIPESQWSEAQGKGFKRAN